MALFFSMRKKHSNTIREQVKKAYSAIAGEFDQSRKVQWSEFQDFLPFIKKHSKVLDLGCGNGRFYELLKDKDVDYLGVDNNSHLLEKARENFPNTVFKIGDMADLNLPDNTFDAIVSIAAFHHLPGRRLRQKSVSEMHRVLKKDGVLILTVWNLFQSKYFLVLLKSIFSFLIHFGLRYAWNDLWIKWGKHPIKRYYHAFLPNEFLHYFKNKNWEIKEFYFVKRGNRVSFKRSFNLCLIATKK